MSEAPWILEARRIAAAKKGKGKNSNPTGGAPRVRVGEGQTNFGQTDLVAAQKREDLQARKRSVTTGASALTPQYSPIRGETRTVASQPVVDQKLVPPRRVQPLDDQTTAELNRAGVTKPQIGIRAPIDNISEQKQAEMRARQQYGQQQNVFPAEDADLLRGVRTSVIPENPQMQNVTQDAEARKGGFVQGVKDFFSPHGTKRDTAQNRFEAQQRAEIATQENAEAGPGAMRIDQLKNMDLGQPPAQTRMFEGVPGKTYDQAAAWMKNNLYTGGVLGATPNAAATPDAAATTPSPVNALALGGAEIPEAPVADTPVQAPTAAAPVKMASEYEKPDVSSYRKEDGSIDGNALYGENKEYYDASRDTAGPPNIGVGGAASIKTRAPIVPAEERDRFLAGVSGSGEYRSSSGGGDLNSPQVGTRNTTASSYIPPDDPLRRPLSFSGGRNELQPTGERVSIGNGRSVEKPVGRTFSSSIGTRGAPFTINHRGPLADFQGGRISNSTLRGLAQAKQNQLAATSHGGNGMRSTRQGMSRSEARAQKSLRNQVTREYDQAIRDITGTGVKSNAQRADLRNQKIEALNTMRGQDMTADTAARTNNTIARGQDIRAQTEARGQDITARGQDSLQQYRDELIRQGYSEQEAAQNVAMYEDFQTDLDQFGVSVSVGDEDDPNKAKQTAAEASFITGQFMLEGWQTMGKSQRRQVMAQSYDIGTASKLLGERTGTRIRSREELLNMRIDISGNQVLLNQLKTRTPRMRELIPGLGTNMNPWQYITGDMEILGPSGEGSGTSLDSFLTDSKLSREEYGAWISNKPIERK